MLMVVMNGSIQIRISLSRLGLAHFEAGTRSNLPNLADTWGGPIKGVVAVLSQRICASYCESAVAEPPGFCKNLAITTPVRCEDCSGKKKKKFPTQKPYVTDTQY